MRINSEPALTAVAMPRKQKLSEGDKAIVAKAGVDNTARRTWDKEEFAAKAAAQEKKVLA